MTNIAYDDRLDVTNSRVIRTVFYNREEELLFVLLRKDDVLCGYQNVPAEVFTSFQLSDEVGDSVGAYWNVWVRNRYEGFDTKGVHLVSRDELTGDGFSISTNGTAQFVSILPVNPPKAPEKLLRHAVSFTHHTLLTVSETITVFATDVEQAKELLEAIAAIAGYTNVRLVSITQFC